jgi:hypothetical protein
MGRRPDVETILREHPRVFPIPLRANVTVRLFDVPADLTPSEADKIARVIKALAEGE